MFLDFHGKDGMVGNMRDDVVGEGHGKGEGPGGRGQWKGGLWSGAWFGTELKVLTCLASTKGIASEWLRSDLKSVAAGTGTRKQIGVRVNHLIAYLAKRKLISRTDTHITIVDYEGLRTELRRGEVTSK
jgi:hypothetical protein